MNRANNKWICIYTNAREENIAFNELLKIGLNLYFPRYKKTVSHARKIIEKIYPLFPRYLFAQLSKEICFSLLKRTRGLADYMHDAYGIPTTVNNKIIHYLKNREDIEGFIQLNNDRFKKGDRITITQGYLKNIPAVFLNQSDEERVKILLELMGREHILKMPLNYIDRLSY